MMPPKLTRTHVRGETKTTQVHDQLNRTYFIALDEKAMSEANVLVYNKVPKCGSTTTLQLLHVSLTCSENGPSISNAYVVIFTNNMCM